MPWRCSSSLAFFTERASERGEPRRSEEDRHPHPHLQGPQPQDPSRRWGVVRQTEATEGRGEWTVEQLREVGESEKNYEEAA